MSELLSDSGAIGKKRLNVTADQSGMRVPDSELDFDENLTYRWHGAPFTGIGYDDTQSAGLSEVSYRHGIQEGPARDWFPSGVLKAESYYRDNVLHGTTREYGEDGVLALEAIYEYGILVEKRERGENGEMIGTYILGPNSELYSLLKRYRREKGWPTLRPTGSVSWCYVAECGDEYATA